MDARDAKLRRRIQAKGWFVTFPKCDWTKETLLEHANKIQEVVEYVIAKEDHKDGTPHLHAFIKFSQKVTFVGMKWPQQGNYQVAKSWKAVQDYCKKGGDFITNLDMESAKAKKGKHASEILNMDPETAACDGSIRWQEITLLHKTQELLKTLGKKRSPSEELTLPKKRHYWIWGGSNTGKTFRREQLEAAGATFQIPYNNDWCGYGKEKVLWADEFKGQLTIQQLNGMCDGGLKVNIKGGSAQLHRRPIVYIFSNFSIRECYQKADQNLWYALENRFIEEELKIIFN